MSMANEVFVSRDVVELCIVGTVVHGTLYHCIARSRSFRNNL